MTLPCPTCTAVVDIYRAHSSNAECFAFHFDPGTRDACPTSHQRVSTTSATPTPEPRTGEGVPASNAFPSGGLTIEGHPALASMRVHPACGAIPPMTPTELANLVESVREHGLLQPVTLYRGELLDGRHRLVACHIAGRKVDFEELDSDVDPYRWVEAVNLERRSLTTTQKAMAAARLSDVYEEARQRRSAPRGALPLAGATHAAWLSEACEAAGLSRTWLLEELVTRRGQLEADLAPRKSSEEAGRRFGVGARSVERARSVIAHGTRELVEAVEAGAVTLKNAEMVAQLPAPKQVEVIQANDPKAIARAHKLHQLAKRATRRKAEEDRLEARRQQAAQQQELATKRIDFRLGKCADVLASLDRRRFPLIFADPPWGYRNRIGNGTAEDHYETQITTEDIVLDLEAAFRVATEHAYLLVWCTGPMSDEFAIARFLADAKLQRWSWRFVTKLYWFKADPDAAPVNGAPRRKGSGHHLRGDVEELLFFAKGRPHPIDKNLSSAWMSPRTEHSEKPVDLAASLIRGLTVADEPVLGLYSGLAPEARAAHEVGRPYLGIDSDPERIAAAVRRLPPTA